jgi:hypothetical protein
MRLRLIPYMITIEQITIEQITIEQITIEQITIEQGLASHKGLPRADGRRRDEGREIRLARCLKFLALSAPRLALRLSIMGPLDKRLNDQTFICEG